MTGPLVVQAIGFSVPGAHADATGASGGAATAVGVGVAVVSLVALLGGTVSANGVTVETLVRLAGVPQTTRPRAEAFAGAGGTSGVVAGAFALSVSAVTSAAAILPGAQVSAGSGNVVVYADANTHAQANTDPTASPGVTPVNSSAAGVGTAITLTVASNVTAAVIGGQIGTTGKVYVLAALAPSGGPSEARTPTYVTRAVAAAGSDVAFDAGGVAGDRGRRSRRTRRSRPCCRARPSPRRWAGLPRPATCSCWPRRTRPRPPWPRAPASDSAVTIAGPLSLNVALNSVLSTSLATVKAATLQVKAAPTGDSSDAYARAGVGGVSPGSTTANSQITGWLGQVSGLISTASALLGSLVPLPAGLPAALGAFGSGRGGSELVGFAGGAGRGGGDRGEPGRLDDVASVPAGGVTVSGPLTVQAIGFTVPGAHADATGASGGAATAVGVGVAAITLVALLGGTVSANGVTVETLVRSGVTPQTTRPVAEAFAGAGAPSTVVAGAFALSVSAVTSAAAILPGAQVSAGSGNVVVYADANTNAQANTNARRLRRRSRQRR